jgi:hypothetical protein
LSREFKPTSLYIKRHRITGLKYLGKTVKNPIFYKGSGKYWLRHLTKHGYDVETLWHQLYNDKQSLMKDAMMLSTKYDVVNSDEWANTKPENGIDGALPGEFHHMYGIIGENHPRFGTKHTDKTKQLMRENHADVSGENNPSYGKHWWTNGVETVKTKICPNGFYAGKGPNRKQYKKGT